MVAIGVVNPSDSKYYPLIFAKDSSTFLSTAVDYYGIPYKWSLPAATTAALVASSVSENYATADSVFHMVKMPDVITYPWTANATYDLVQLQIGWRNCITDGYFVMADV